MNASNIPNRESRRISGWLAFSLTLLSVLACNSDRYVPFVTPVPSPRIVSLDELQFKDAETGQRFRALDRCIKTMVDSSWQTTSYRISGNSYTSSWCRGTGARSDCQIAGSSSDNRDQHVLNLDTLFYYRSYPQVFGLGLHTLWVPESTGWGAMFFFDEKGESIVGDNWGVTFRQYLTPAGAPEATVNLGWNYDYTIYGPNRTNFQFSSDLPMREDLALYLSSPEAMRDRGLAQNEALAQKVNSAITSHQVITCDLGPYQGGGIPPACTPRPLTAGEEASELARAQAYFADQERLLSDNYQEMYAAWMTAFPLDQCWP